MEAVFAPKCCHTCYLLNAFTGPILVMEIATSPSSSQHTDSLNHCYPLTPPMTTEPMEISEEGELLRKLTTFPKPAYAFSSIIALALKNSPDGRLPVWKIYAFILEHFQYFRTATEAWRNSVRHSLSKNGSFEKCPKEEGDRRDGNLWRVIRGREKIVDKEIGKYRLSEKHHKMNLDAMANPEILPELEDGSYGIPPFSSEKEYKLAYNVVNTPRIKDFVKRPQQVEISMSRFVFKDFNKNPTIKTETCASKFDETHADIKTAFVHTSTTCSIISPQHGSELSVHPEEKRFYEKYCSSDSNPLLSSAALPRNMLSEVEDDSVLWESSYESFDAGRKRFHKLNENEFWLPITMTSTFDLPADLSILSDAV
uniref:Fork-head domain-containing protein n=1 Tax=Steinernema glaseri TaxID=37863 RepID=A0A1I8AA58_9BILA